MDKQERGVLLADQEELEKNITGIRKKLTDTGRLWKKLAESIIAKPENVTFSNAPTEFSDIPLHLLSSPSFIWGDIPTIEIMAKLIQDLKAELQKLNAVQAKLRT